MNSNVFYYHFLPNQFFYVHVALKRFEYCSNKCINAFRLSSDNNDNNNCLGIEMKLMKMINNKVIKSTICEYSQATSIQLTGQVKLNQVFTIR